jgi:hypothetical protein
MNKPEIFEPNKMCLFRLSSYLPERISIQSLEIYNRLENLLEYYRKLYVKTKKKIYRLHLLKQLVLEEGKVATYGFTKPKQFLLNASKGFQKSGERKWSKMTSCPVWLTKQLCNITKTATSLFYYLIVQ